MYRTSRSPSKYPSVTLGCLQKVQQIVKFIPKTASKKIAQLLSDKNRRTFAEHVSSFRGVGGGGRRLSVVIRAHPSQCVLRRSGTTAEEDF